MKINNSNGVLTFLNYTNITDKIPVGNYNVMYNKQTDSYYLTKKEDFTLPSKIYGDAEKLVERYLKTFEDKNKTLGVLLAGEKGSGKTLLAQLLCKKANLPVLFIDAAYQGPEFNDFIGNITQEVIIFFDEFEKVYNEQDDQKTLLGILDGNFSNKKLFIFTCNTTYVNSYMTNRPSRIYYKKLYEGLTLQEINEIANHELVNKNNLKGLVEVCTGIGKVNIDLVRSLIEEMNRYSETAKESFKYLNIKAERENHTVKIFNSKDGRMVYSTELELNLRADGFEIARWIDFAKEDAEDEEGKVISVDITFNDLELMEENVYKYTNPSDDSYYIIIAKKVYGKNLTF